jgi:hypothetical protein
MEFRFDANQGFQIHAIEAIADLFDGQNYQSEIAAESREEIEACYGKPIGDLTDTERRKIEEKLEKQNQHP